MRASWRVWRKHGHRRALSDVSSALWWDRKGAWDRAHRIARQKRIQVDNLALCAGKKRETVERLALENSGIRVDEYMTELPPRKALEQKLHCAQQSKEYFQNRPELPSAKNDEGSKW